MVSPTTWLPAPPMAQWERAELQATVLAVQQKLARSVLLTSKAMVVAAMV
jgi:hypothetical protein